MDDPEEDKADLKRGFGRAGRTRSTSTSSYWPTASPIPSGGREALLRFAES